MGAIFPAQKAHAQSAGACVPTTPPTLAATSSVDYGDYALPAVSGTRLLKGSCQPLFSPPAPYPGTAPALPTGTELSVAAAYHVQGGAAEDLATVTFELDANTGAVTCLTYDNSLADTEQPCTTPVPGPLVDVSGSFSSLTFSWPASLEVFRVTVTDLEASASVYQVLRTRFDEAICQACQTLNELPGAAVGPPTIELTFPAGPSPKVFTTGWVFGALASVECDDGTTADLSEQVMWTGSGPVEPPTFDPVQGSRSRPEFHRSGGRNTITLSVEVEGQPFEESFEVDAVPPAQYLVVNHLSFVPADVHGCPACAHPAIGPLLEGSPTVSVCELPVGRVGDLGVHVSCCDGNTWNAAKGDPEVVVDGMRVPRIGDQSLHCGGTGYVVTGLSGACSQSMELPPGVVEALDHATAHPQVCVMPWGPRVRSAAGPQSATSPRGGGSPGSISGRVTDPDGVGIAQAEVHAFRSGTPAVFGVRTDSTGAYTIPALEPGDYDVFFSAASGELHEGFIESWYAGREARSQADRVVVAPDTSVAGIDAALARGGSIRGRVSDGTGDPVVEAVVQAFAGAEIARMSVTDQEGRYSLVGLAPGDYELRSMARGKGFAPQWQGGSSDRSSAATISVAAEQHRSDIDFSMQRGAGIAGTVTDALAAPLEGLFVAAMGSGLGNGAVAVTAGDGTYAISGLPPDDYRVEFRGRALGLETRFYMGTSSWDAADVLTVASGETVSGIDIALARDCGGPADDNDGDGTADCDDACPFDADKLAPGACGCGHSETDSDADGTADCDDLCPFDPSKLAPGSCGCGLAEATPNCSVATCGDAATDLRLTASDALIVLQAAVGARACERCRCDVDASDSILASDALAVLQVAVGIPRLLLCPPCL